MHRLRCAAARWGGLGLLTSAAFAVRLWRLSESAEPPGWDGYYYVVQADSLWLEGRLHVPDASWVLYLFGALRALVGEPVGAVQLGSSLLAAACVPVSFWVGRALARRESAGWWLAAWAAASPSLTHLAADFPKNLGVAAPLLAMFACAASERPRVRVMAAAFAFAASLAHRLGAALVIIALAGGLAGWLLRRRRAGAIWPVALSLAALAAFAVASAVLPNLLHPEDLSRLQGQFSLRPGWPPPIPYFALRATAWPERIELMLPWLALPAGVVALARWPEHRPQVAASLACLACIVLPTWRGDALDVGYRLSLMGPLVSVPIATAWASRSSLAPRRWLLAPALAAVLLARAGFGPEDGPPYRRYRKLVDAVPRPLPELLIAHQGISFLYDHRTGHEAMAWAPEPWLDRSRVGRLAWGIRDGEWEAFAAGAEPAPRRIDSDYVYVREDVWEAFAAQARVHGDDELRDRLEDWRNPSRVRPRSLLRNR